MTKIFNATQHIATDEQRAAGVVDLLPEEREILSSLLTFDTLPTHTDMQDRAIKIAYLLSRASIHHGDVDHVMLGGAPFFMPVLQEYLQSQGWCVLYAFSRRESVEQTQEDGSVRKVNIFRHIGFVGI